VTMDIVICTGIFVIVFVFLEAGFLAFQGMKNPERSEVRKRLKVLSSTEFENRSIDILRKNLLSDVRWLNQVLLSFRWTDKLNRLIQQADAQYTLSVYILLSLLMASVGFLVGSLFTSNRSVLVLFACLVGMIPFSYLYLMKKRRMEKFQRQLPDALELMARALRAGHAFTGGLKMVADELGDPIGVEFAKTLHEINFGVGIPDALKNLPDRIDCPDLKFFIISVIVQRETGGNLAEILEKIAHLIRERFKLQGQIHVLSSEGKLSALILITLPFLIGLTLYVLNPGYISTLFIDPIGRILVAFALAMMLIGALVMKRMVEIRV
jgi:tight adherence protein B